MNLIRKHIVLLCICMCCCLQAQQKFRILDGKSKTTIPFKLVNNLIVIPVEINGVEMSFLLDSGVNKPILFSLNPGDSLQIEQRERIQLRGLGSGSSVTAVKARANKFDVKNVRKWDLEIYIILDEEINVSTRLGIPVHGIIGYDFFKDFIVEINYSASKLKVYDPERYRYKSCKKCSDLPLTFKNNKPYIDVAVSIKDEEKKVPVKLLIDSGGSDALWLFEDELKAINVPKPSFDDFLGRGLSGSIYGKRARVNEFYIGDYTLEQAKVAFPDSSAIAYVKNFRERNGSIGGEILKRFKVTFDYGNKKIRLRKSKYFAAPFRYNMSGIELQHNGMRVVSELKKKNGNIRTNYGRETQTGDLTVVYEYFNKFSLVKSYEVAELRKDSPAAIAGIREGDIIISINGRSVAQKSLNEVTEMLQGKEDQKIRLKIMRRKMELKFEFRLQEVL